MQLWERLIDRTTASELLVPDEARYVRHPRAALVDDAESAAAFLTSERGVASGERVACVLTNTAEVCAGAVGVWLSGGVVVSLPIPARAMRPADYQAQLARICDLADARLLLVERRFLPWLELERVEVLAYEELRSSRRMDPVPPADDEVAFVQFSSGSTSAPRGCLLTTAAIDAQLSMLAAALELDPERDRGAMWLPLSHDMGFFGGVMLLWAYAVSGILSAPERFLAGPETWLQDCAAINATLTAAPAFALELAARRSARVGLARAVPLRSCLLGGELIPPATLERAARDLGPLGWTLATLTPAYGLAEATLAVTMSRTGTAPRIDRGVDVGGEPRDVVSVGRPLDGVSVRIDYESGGEICVRSPSLAQGYLAEPEATSRNFRDGELRTGDLGYVRDGELHVLGRADDMLKVGARKVFASDVERAVEALGGVRAGGSALIALADPAAVRHVLLMEPYVGSDELCDLARAAARRALHGFGVRVDEVVVLDPGELPKTPSGKVQRHRCASLARDLGRTRLATGA